MSSHAATPAASAVKPVVVVVDTFGGPIRHHNPELPLIYWDDAAVTRGDGVFETLLIRDGHACNLERHSKRFAASAALLGLPEPDAEYWRAATAEAIESWPKDVDASCVWTLTRGRTATNRPSAWITVKQIPVEHLEQRHLGVSVMTAPRGFSVTATPDEAAPWMIVGAKTLSYAANMAALRHARSCGFDDVIYVDGDCVLEGATSTVVAAQGTALFTPTPGGDVLPGTTQAALYQLAEWKGWDCQETDLTVQQLIDADSVWLVSSVRVAARVTRINDVHLPAPANEDKVRRMMFAALS